MGLGCNAVGVMGCRILSSPRQRRTAILTNAMVPCNGRFPALIFLGVFCFGKGGGALAVAVCIALGMTGAMVATAALNRSQRNACPYPYIMELPPLRRPQLGKVLIGAVGHKAGGIIARAAVASALAGALLWLLTCARLLQPFANLLNPLGRIMGMSGTILLCFVLSLPANELFLPLVFATMDVPGLLSTKMALCMMVFTLFHWPCVTTLLTIRKETNSYKNTAVAVFLPTAVGILLCMLIIRAR